MPHITQVNRDATKTVNQSVKICVIRAKLFAAGKTSLFTFVLLKQRYAIREKKSFQYRPYKILQVPAFTQDDRRKNAGIIKAGQNK